jgi:hypothetical protein
MEEHESLNRIYSYLFYGGSLAMLASAFFFSNIYLVVAAILLCSASAAYMKSGHILNNLLLKHSRIIEVCNGYKLAPQTDSAVKRIGKSYQGLSIALLDISRSQPVSGNYKEPA